MTPRISGVAYLSNHLLRLRFTNGELKIFDLKPYLHYPIFQALADEAFCQRVSLFNGTIKWDDSIDFDPDTLYLESVAAEKMVMNS